MSLEFAHFATKCTTAMTGGDNDDNTTKFDKRIFYLADLFYVTQFANRPGEITDDS